MAQPERVDLARDAEQFADEIIERGRERDDEIGFGLAGRRRRRRTRRHQAIVEAGVARLERVGKQRVEPHQPVAPVEVLEGEAEPEC